MLNYIPVINSNTVIAKLNRHRKENKYLQYLKFLSEFETEAEQTRVRNNINAQEKLVSGVNIATINGVDITKGGNIEIRGGGGGEIPDLSYKPLPKVVIEGKWTIYDYLKLFDFESLTLNPTIDFGQYASFTGSYKWYAEEDARLAIDVSKNCSWEEFPNLNELSTSKTFNLTNSPQNIIASVVVPKSGWEVINGHIQQSKGEEVASTQIHLNFRYNIYYGNTQVIDSEIFNTLTLEKRTGRGIDLTASTKLDDSYFVYAYPQSLGLLKAIIWKQSDFLGAFEYTTIEVQDTKTGIIPYYVYWSRNKGAFDNQILNFK